MTPQAREALRLMLGEARRAVAERRQTIDAAPDGALVRLLGISDAAACRRIAATPRVARRLIGRLGPAIAAEREAMQLGSLLLEDLPTDPDAVKLADVEGHSDAPLTDAGQPDFNRPEADAGLAAEAADLVRLVAAAIRLSGAGVLLGREELDGALSLYGADAVDFALKHRRQVPDWMQAAAGGRSDLHRQFAASAVVCHAEETAGMDAGTIREQLAGDEPLPLSGADVRTSAFRLVEAAGVFAAHYAPDDASENAFEDAPA